MRRNITLITLFTLLAASVAHATTVWDESVNGDLSNSQAAPTAVTLALGTNSVIASLRTSPSTDSQDWVAVTIPAGLQMNSLVLAAYSSSDAQGFTGFQGGSSFVGSVNTPGNYKGYAHFGTGATNGSLPPTNLIGADLLPIMADNSVGGTSAGAQGFTIPLAAGVYTFLIQQTGGSATSYQFDYNLTAVPEPAAISLIAAFSPLLLRRKRSN